MSLGPAERKVLAALADVLIPAGDGFPAASQAGVSREGIDQVLAARPDLEAGLARVLAAAEGRDAEELVAELRAGDPAGFGVLAEVVPGAYFLDAGVRASIGYHGQTAQPIDPADGVDRELLRPVIERGPIYRPTPGAPGIREDDELR